MRLDTLIKKLEEKREQYLRLHQVEPRLDEIGTDLDGRASFELYGKRKTIRWGYEYSKTDSLKVKLE